MRGSVCMVMSLALVLGACSTQRGGGYYENDGPPRRVHVDPSRIADANPVAEPRSTSGNDPYIVFGKTYLPLQDASGYRERGIASWYGKKFHGKRTSSGEPYDMYAMTAAHKTLPLPTYVRVTNLRNGRVAVLRVNDRGPFLHNRLIDLSYAAALKLDIVKNGTAVVEVETLGIASSKASAQDGVEAMPEAPKHLSTDLRLYLQVGAFANWENAASLRARLASADFGAVFIQSELRDDTRFYRVRVGPVGSVERIDELVQRANDYGLRDTQIVVE